MIWAWKQDFQPPDVILFTDRRVTKPYGLDGGIQGNQEIIDSGKTERKKMFQENARSLWKKTMSLSSKPQAAVGTRNFKALMEEIIK